MSFPGVSFHAVDIEADSVSMRVADLLVGISIRRASTFKRYRVVDLYCLYRRALGSSANRYHLAKGDVRFCLHRLPGASLCQATADSLCPVCPPASQRLEISFQLDMTGSYSQSRVFDLLDQTLREKISCFLFLNGA